MVLNKFNNSSFEYILDFLDKSISDVLINIHSCYKDKIQEIRLRTNRPLMISMDNKNYFVNKEGTLSKFNINSYIVNEKNIYNTFKLICNYSIYAVDNELKNGFITIKGGHRVGITGKVIYNNENIQTIRDISSINIRIAKQVIGVSDSIMKYIIKTGNTIYHTLIISPPKCGKTTLLRDIIRNLSDGINKFKFAGLKVGVVDERSEIAGLYNGIPQNYVGNMTDVLDNCKKFDGINMLIRSMSPDVIATDELGDKRDIEAIHLALKAGVKLISTVHGYDIEDIKTKPYLKEIINENIFERYIILDNTKGVGTIKNIIDGKTFKSLYKVK